MRAPFPALTSAAVFAAASGLAMSAGAQSWKEPGHPLLHRLASEVRPTELQATIKTLVAFGTRHTLSDTTSSTRGVGAAERWAAARFQSLDVACGGCLQVVTPSETFTGTRVPTPTAIGAVAAIQRGTTDPDRVVLITAHIDSRVSDVMNATSDAPGANDDGSGVAAVMEAARILSRQRFPATVVYAVEAGEEQGLYGAKALADYAVAHGWRVEADLNNDIIGNIHGGDGRVVDGRVRVFSEGTRQTETPAETKQRQSTGGEVDSPSRELARFIAALAPRYVPGFQVQMIYRTDRFSRGGDQERFLEAGYPAVRLTEADENYTRQHQDVRQENGVAYGDVASGVDPAYLAQVTRVNVVALAALAMAPSPPAGLKITGAVTPDTKLSWNATPGAATYRAWWRDTTAPQWSDSRDAGSADAITLPDVNIDNALFGVSAISADGYASPVEFPGPVGAFDRPSAVEVGAAESRQVPQPSSPAPHIDFSFQSTVYLKAGASRYFVDVKWSETPNALQIAAEAPKDYTTSSVGTIVCHGFAADGGLDVCNPEDGATPMNTEAGRSLIRLVPFFRADPNFVRTLNGGIRFIDLFVYFRPQGSTLGFCLPFCVMEPPPPPPPKSVVTGHPAGSDR